MRPRRRRFELAGERVEEHRLVHESGGEPHPTGTASGDPCSGSDSAGRPVRLSAWVYETKLRLASMSDSATGGCSLMILTEVLGEERHSGERARRLLGRPGEPASPSVGRRTMASIPGLKPSACWIAASNGSPEVTSPCLTSAARPRAS